jgi:hypothetical protein
MAHTGATRVSTRVAEGCDRHHQEALLVIKEWSSGIVRRLAAGAVAGAAGTARSSRWWAYKPIWAYDAQTLANDLSAHLVFGSTTSAVFAALTRERP